MALRRMPVYLKDVLTKLRTWPNSRLYELLPHRWTPPEPASTPAGAAASARTPACFRLRRGKRTLFQP